MNGRELFIETLKRDGKPERLLKQFEGTRKLMKSAVTGNLMARMKGFRR